MVDRVRGIGVSNHCGLFLQRRPRSAVTDSEFDGLQDDRSQSMHCALVTMHCALVIRWRLYSGAFIKRPKGLGCGRRWPERQIASRLAPPVCWDLLGLPATT